MIALFKQKNPLNLFLLLFFAIVIKLPLFKSGYVPVPYEMDGVFYKWIVNFLVPYSKNFSALFPLLAFLFLLIQSLLLNWFMNSQRMLNRQNYLPAMCYLLVTSLIPEWNLFSAPLLVNTILLVILINLFKTYHQPQAKAALYNLGFLLGIVSFLFFPAIAFLFWAFLAMMIIRPFRINEWLLCLLGITTPVYFYAAYLFLTDQWSWSALAPQLKIGLPVIEQTIYLAVGLLLLVLPFLTGAWFVQDNLRKMLINIRKAWSLFLIYLLVAILVPLLQSGNGIENWILIVVPFAAFHASAYMFTAWRLIPILFFWLSVAFVLYYQYYELGWQLPVN